MISRVDFDFAPRGTRSRWSSDAELTRVLVIADLKGEAARGELDAAPILRVEVGNFESVLRSLRPEVRFVTSSGSPHVLRFESFADFHPDELYETVRSLPSAEPPRANVAPPPPAATELEDDATTLARLLGGRPARSDAGSPPSAAAAPKPSGVLDRMLHELVSPHIVRDRAKPAGDEPTDAALGAEVRRALHTPAFQRLEAAWRGLRWLVFENALGPALEVHVLDTSREALLADLRACEGDIERSALYRHVVPRATGADATGYALVVGDLDFEGTAEDVSLLAALGAVAARAGGCFLGGATPPLWGGTDLARQPERGTWSALEPERAARLAALRCSAVAPFIGLGMPRVLGRVPYGDRSDPVERFAFTELPDDPDHTHFLWLNAAFAIARVILDGVAERGWADGPGSVLDLGDLPHARYRLAGGDAIKPCAEVYLDEASAEHALSHGLMPLLSYRNRNAARLLRLQSIASPSAPLAWPGSRR